MTPATLRRAELRMWLDELDALDAGRRLVAGERVCEMLGLADAVRAVAPDGALRPPPAWPLVDIVPVATETDGVVRRVVVEVRTAVQGVRMTERLRVEVGRRGLEPGALEEAVERGRRALGGRLL